MASWSEWFKESGKFGFNLKPFLLVHLSRDLRRLYDSGLPCYDSLLIDGSEYSNSSDKVKPFCLLHRSVWLRVYHKSEPDKRFYRLDLHSFDEIDHFIRSIKVDLTQFMVHLFEFQKNRFGGNVISDGTTLYLEIIEGLQEWVSRSDKDFFHARTNFFGQLEFIEKSVPLPVKISSQKVLRYLRISRNEFLVGYFEFLVSDDNRVFFLDWNDLIK